MKFTYTFVVADANQVATFDDLFEAFEMAYLHLNDESGRPLSIVGIEQTSVFDLPIILQEWRRQPELQMAVLAERYAVQIEQIETNFDEALKRLSESFRTDMLALVAVRDHRKQRYSEPAIANLSPLNSH